MKKTSGFSLNDECENPEAAPLKRRRRCKFGGDLPKGLLLLFTIQEFIRDLRAQGFECKFDENSYDDYKRLAKKMEGMLTSVRASLPTGVEMPRFISRMPHVGSDKVARLN